MEVLTQPLPQLQQIPEQQEQEKQNLDCFVFTWGKNKDGELSIGFNTTKIVNLPTHPKGVKNQSIMSISSGSQHTGVITDAGQLYICGSSLHGKLGIEDINVTNINKFQHLNIFDQQKVKQVACGDYHTLCLLNNGEVYAWGGTLHKKLGGQRFGKPGLIHSLKKKNIIQVGCGDFHSVALSENGEMYTWGGGGSYFNKGQLGHGHLNDIENPEMVQALKSQFIVKFSCGGYHTMALAQNGELYAWGSGIYGECGFGDFIDTSLPKKVNLVINQQDKQFYPTQEEIQQNQIKDISCGGHHSLILTNGGQVYSCGNGSHGQLGLKTTTNQKEPVLVQCLLNKVVVQIAAGWNHSLVLTSTENIYACGHGSSGQLGLADEESRTIFTHVQILGGYNISKVFAGGNHSWAVIDSKKNYIDDYRPPSPLKLLDNSYLGNDLQQQAKQNSQIDSNFIIKDDNDNKTSSNQIQEKMLQVIYCEVDMCHRFAKFTYKEGKEDQFKIKMDEYLKEIYNSETGIQFSKLSCDLDLVDQNCILNVFNGEKINEQNKQILQRSYTLMIVCNPGKNTPPIKSFDKQDQLLTFNIDYPKKSTVIGDMTILRESDILKEDKERALGSWFLIFTKLFNNITEKMKFFELRPQTLYP